MSDAEQYEHRVFLIRHGETVDNIAGLYAGIRDSALTNHGVQQITRLGQYFAEQGHIFTHIFSSDLSRAHKTAEAIRTAQTSAKQTVSSTLRTVIVPNLREQDFGHLEGKSVSSRIQSPPDRRKASALKKSEENGRQNAESKVAMARRADAFLDDYLMPLLGENKSECDLKIAVVSHGMLLGTLWHCLLNRQDAATVSLGPEVSLPNSNISLHHLGGWSNSGYLELVFSRRKAHLNPASSVKLEKEQSSDSFHAAVSSDTIVAHESSEPSPSSSQEKAQVLQTSLHSLAKSSSYPLYLKVLRVNSKDHLQSLKRTRGGVGSSKFDEGQKSIDCFFKRTKHS